jgi:hypothetical protein
VLLKPSSATGPRRWPDNKEEEYLRIKGHSLEHTEAGRVQVHLSKSPTLKKLSPREKSDLPRVTGQVGSRHRFPKQM